MSLLGAQLRAREWLSEHPDCDIHGEAFRRWCAAREINSEGARAVRIQVIRLRAFGAPTEATAHDTR
ncbi:MAG: hypothetical protein JXO72_16500 [Vicinamibacteria bacterium]|nr:hypothetical protein [Vicinamibacteria bacterium]